MKNPLQKILAAEPNQAEWARRINAVSERSFSPQAFHKWVKKKLIPEDRALDVEEASGGDVDARDVLEYARHVRRSAKKATA